MRNRVFRLLVVILGLVAFTSCNLFKKDDEDELWYTYFDFEVDGIAYNFVDEGVEVVAKTEPSNYSNEITIPSEVDYEGTPCEVVGIGKLAFYESKVTSVTLPETVRYLGSWCFSGCKNLKSLQLTKGLQDIHYQVFSDSGLESITIPASVTFIGANEPFPPQLKSFTIESSKTPLSTDDQYGWFITYGAYEELESIFIGRNLDGDHKWDSYNDLHELDYEACNNLKKVRIGEYVTEFGASFDSTLEIICEPTLPPATSGNCSPKCLQTSTVYVPRSAIELYREDSYWGRFKNIKALEEL